MQIITVYSVLSATYVMSHDKYSDNRQYNRLEHSTYVSVRTNNKLRVTTLNLICNRTLHAPTACENFPLWKHGNT